MRIGIEGQGLFREKKYVDSNCVSETKNVA